MAREKVGFRERLAALWTALSLGPVTIEVDGAAFLDIEGRAVRLSPSADGASIEISSVVGTLSRDARRQGEEIKAVLRRSLALLTASRTGIMLGAEDDSRSVILRASIHIEKAETRALIAVIEDLVARAADYATLLARQDHAPQRSTAAGRTTALADIGTEAIIFRP